VKFLFESERKKTRDSVEKKNNLRRISDDKGGETVRGEEKRERIPVKGKLMCTGAPTIRVYQSSHKRAQREGRGGKNAAS